MRKVVAFLLLIFPWPVHPAMADSYVICYKSQGACGSCFKPARYKAPKSAKVELVCPEGTSKTEFSSVTTAREWMAEHCNCPERGTTVPPIDFD